MLGQPVPAGPLSQPGVPGNIDAFVQSAAQSVLQGTPTSAARPVYPQAGVYPQMTMAPAQDAVLFERPGGFLQEGKWQNGKITLKGTSLNFLSKGATAVVILAEIESVTPGDKGNLFDVKMKTGQVKNFRAEKGQVWVDKIRAAMPRA